MCDSLYFAIVQHECGFNQGFTIACGAGAYDCCIIRKQRVNLLNRTDCGFERAAVIIAIERIQQSTIFIYQSYFGSGRSGINTQIAFSVVIADITGFYMMSAVSVLELFIFCFISKERVHTGYFKFHFNIGRELIHHFLHGESYFFFGI